LVVLFVVVQIRKGLDATIPIKVLGQRSVLISSLFSCFLSMGLYSHIFYLPFYFQAIKGTTAEGSGLRTIPYLVSVTLSSIVIGASITIFGHYVPFMIIGSGIFTIGAGTLYTLGVHSSAGKWIGYQLLTGIGAGASIQIPFIAVQVVLNAAEMPTGNAIVMFFNSLGGAISISIAQNVFTNSLVKDVPAATNGVVSGSDILAIGATGLRTSSLVPSDLLEAVLGAYDKAITTAFILPIAVGAISCLIAFGMEWKSVKGKKLSHAAAA